VKFGPGGTSAEFRQESSNLFKTAEKKISGTSHESPK
jgi:hypothetical protein